MTFDDASLFLERHAGAVSPPGGAASVETSDALLAPGDVALIARARPLFAEQGEATAAAFYDTLFLNSPELRAFFPRRMADQRRKLAAALALLIDSARDPLALGPALDALARRHLAYGVRRRHYEAVGAALLATLEVEGLPRAELDAWARAYGAVSRRMIAAAYPAC